MPRKTETITEERVVTHYVCDECGKPDLDTSHSDLECICGRTLCYDCLKEDRVILHRILPLASSEVRALGYNGICSECARLLKPYDEELTKLEKKSQALFQKKYALEQKLREMAKQNYQTLTGNRPEE